MMNWNKILIKNIDQFDKKDNILIDKKSRDETYDNIADFYDDTRSKLPDSIFSILWEKGIVKEDNVILDLGCGTGRSSLKLIKSFPINVIGIDISFSMLRKFIFKLTNNSEKVLLIQGDAAALPFKDNSIDICIEMALFHLLENYKTVIEEVKRVLKADGKLIIPRLSLISTSNDFLDKAWEIYYSLLEDEGVDDLSNAGPSRKKLFEYLEQSFEVEQIRVESLISEETYSMKKMFFEIENQSDSNTVRIDKEINKRAVARLRERLKEEFGEDYMELSQIYKSERIIMVSTPITK